MNLEADEVTSHRCEHAIEEPFLYAELPCHEAHGIAREN